MTLRAENVKPKEKTRRSDFKRFDGSRYFFIMTVPDRQVPFSARRFVSALQTGAIGYAPTEGKHAAELFIAACCRSLQRAGGFRR